MSELHNPYVGLRPFFLRDSLHFFGRETQTAELLEVLRQHRFLGVVGSSGSGKSSLVRAGLMPALLGGFLVGDRDRWQIVQIKPGDTPMRNLAAGLLAASSETPPAETEIAVLEAAIRDEQADAVVAFVKERLTSRESLFVLVDQFEEIFAFRRAGPGGGSNDEQRAEAADFVSLLMALAEEHVDVPVFVALTMRTDFLGDCDLFYGLPETMNRGQYLVPRLTRQQLRLAIEGPAMLTGASFAPQLIDLLLNQLGDREDRLPVIQHALLRTWDAWHASGATGPIDVRHFEEAGGLENALNVDAEAALAEVRSALPAIDDRVIARVFKALTDTDLSHRAVRRPARVHELMAASGADRATVDTIIRCFSRRNRSFLQADGWPDAPDPRVDISHESLIRQWTRLRDWVVEEREMRDQFTALTARARSWQKHGVVLQRNELKSAEAWWKSAEPSGAWARRYAVADDDFAVAQQHLTSSTKTRTRTKVTRLSAAVVVATVTGTLAYVQYTKAKTAADMELLRDKESQATALLERDPESALAAGLIAAEAHTRLYPGADLPVTLETVLLRGWQESALAETRQLAFNGDIDSALLPADSRLVLLQSVSALGAGSVVRAYDLGKGDLLNETAARTTAEGCSALSPDGGRLNFTENGISGQWLISSGADGKVEQFEKDYRSRRWVDCEYSPDATRIALISHTLDGLADWVLTLAAVSDDRITKIREIPLAAKAEYAAALRFSQSGKHIAVAVATRETETALTVIDANTGAAIRKFTTANPVEDLALSRTGVLVTVEKAYTYALFLRSIEDDTIAAVLPNSGSDDVYGGLAFSPDGARLAAVNGDTARLWEVGTGLDIGSFKGHPRSILAVGFDAKDRLVTVGQDADIRYWRAGTREKYAFQPEQNLQSALMSLGGTSVITTTIEGAVTGWSMDHRGPPSSATLVSSGVIQVALSGDGRILVELVVPNVKLGRKASGSIRILEARSHRLLAEMEGGSLSARLALSPDGRRLAMFTGSYVRIWTLPAADAQPYRPSESFVISRIGMSRVDFEGATFSADETGRQLATSDEHEVFLWNAATGACEGIIDTQSQVFSLAYAPGGAQIATGDVLGRVRFWPLDKVQRAGCDNRWEKKDRSAPDSTLQAHRGPVRAITFPGDGSRFATASDDRTAKVWDTKTGRVLLTLRHAGAVKHAVFSSDGKLLMTTAEDRGAKVWEIPLREQIVSFARARVTAGR